MGMLQLSTWLFSNQKQKCCFAWDKPQKTQIRLQTEEHVFGTQKQRFEWGEAEINVMSCNQPETFFAVLLR